MRYDLVPVLPDNVIDEWRAAEEANFHLAGRPALYIRFRGHVLITEMSFKRIVDRFGVTRFKVRIGERSVIIRPNTNRENEDMDNLVPVLLKTDAFAATTCIALCLRDRNTIQEIVPNDQ